MRIAHGGTTNAHGACTVRYGTSTIHGGSSVVKPWMIRGVKDSTTGYDLSRIAANIATVSVRISMITLRLRYKLGHAQ